MDRETVMGKTVKGTKVILLISPLSCIGRYHMKSILFHTIPSYTDYKQCTVSATNSDLVFCFCIPRFLQSLRVQLSNPSCTRGPAAKDRKHILQ